MTRAHRVDELNDGDVVYVALDADGVWARSTFPHPLITIDHDEDDNVIGISAAGPRTDQLIAVYGEWHRETDRDHNRLVARLEDQLHQPATI